MILNKAWAYILLVLLIVIFVFIIVKLFTLRVSFFFKLRDITLSDFSFQDLFNQGQTHFKVLVDAQIKNDNNVNLTFSDATVWFYVDGHLIAKTAENVPLNFAKILVPAKGQASTIETLDLFINTYTVELVRKLKNKEQVKIDYYVRGKIWGIPFTWKDYFNTI